MQAILGLQRLKLSSPILKSIVTRYASKASVVKKRRTILVSIKGEILYGSHPVLLALEASKRTFHCVYYLPTSSRIHEIIDICNSRGIDTREVKRTLLNQLTRVEGSEGPHKGVCADVEPLVPKADDWIVDEELVDPGKDRLWLLLCSIGDPYNLGAIIRTAYFLGVEKVLTCSPWDCPQAMAPLTPIASRASAGAIEVFTPTTIRQPEIFLQKLKEKGWSVIGSSSVNEENPCLRTEHKGKSKILLIGNEGFGVPDSLMTLCDSRMSLSPGRKLHDRIDSLNVSVATALMIRKTLDL